MNPMLTWWFLLSCLIKQVHLESHLSKQEFALLAMDKDPKCFTRDLEHFTCLWEAPVGKSYYFLYIIDELPEEKRCDVKQQIYEEKKDLYYCTFPSSDVFIYVKTNLTVIDRDTNTTIYSRTVSVEDQLLLYPPSNISLHPTGEVGQLLVKWKSHAFNLRYEIRYSSKNTPNTVGQVSKHPHKLVSLVAGENCTVQMRVKPSDGSLWSDWSSPVTAMVPQTAGDIELRCHTPDLIQVLCKWRGELYDDGRYSLLYRQMNRSSWGIWKLCSKGNNTEDQCVLDGQESSVFQFYLSAGLQPFGQTFYAETFSMNSSIKTRPPGGLKEKPEEGRLCLAWDPPFLKISQYLKYQIRYQRERESEWKDFTAPSSKTSTCLDVHRGSQYTIQVRAQPNGFVYSGDWSDWSKPLTVLLPSLDKEWIFIVCIAVTVLIIASAMISFFSRYFRKVKKSLWPSVPNLNKVLESFLTDISGAHWEPTFNIKQCDDDTATSVVEILPESEATEKPSRKSTCLLLSDRGFLSGEKNGENFRENFLEMAEDYVILNNDKIPCFTGNDYVYRDVALSHVTDEKLHCWPNTCSTTFPEFTSNILNHSYLLLAEQSELEEYHSACRQYSNMEIKAIPCVANVE